MGSRTDPHVISRIAESLIPLLHGETSFAREYEDIILFRYLHPVEFGFYIDVGCGDPEILSSTRLFYEKGWRGVNIDPLQCAMDKYARERERDINCCLAVSDENGERELYDGGFGSTLDEEEAGERHLTEKILVPVEPLSHLLGRLAVPPDIHFLKIAVGKHEKNVLDGMDFRRFRPWLVVLDTAFPQNGKPCHEEREHILSENGYVSLARQGSGRYYCAAEKRDELVANYLSAPVTAVLDSDQFDALQACVWLLLRNKNAMRTT